MRSHTPKYVYATSGQFLFIAKLQRERESEGERMCIVYYCVCLRDWEEFTKLLRSILNFKGLEAKIVKEKY